MKGIPFPAASLRQRLFLTLTVCAFLFLAMMIAVSYVTLQAADRTRVESMLAGDLAQIAELVDSEYGELVQMSQQLVPQSSIGGLIEAYLRAEETYDRIELLREIAAGITIMRFSHDNSSLFLCYRPAPGGAVEELYYSTLGVSPAFASGSLGTLKTTGYREPEWIRFHAVHPSECVVYNKDTVSISRAVALTNGTVMEAYLELFTAVPEQIASLSELRGMPYGLIQTDEEGIIRYSTSGDFPPGELFSLPGEEGRGGVYSGEGHRFLQSASRYGFRNILVVPQSNYNSAMRMWQGGIVAVVITAAVFVSITVSMLFYLIFRPLDLLRGEIVRVGKGDFTQSSHVTRLAEFDRIFGSMEEMKVQIQELLRLEREQEKASMQLELDKLYYQINPHFLMNALNTVHWMAVTNGQKEIDRFVHQLNYILGYSLGKTNCNATLHTEILSLRAYLDLQLCRYDFHVHYDIQEGDYLHTPCARLILQPIAENSVCHNMVHLGNLWVRVSQQGDAAEIVIRDDGQGFDMEAGGLSGESGMKRGIGLRYVELSLAAYYGGDALFRVESVPGQGATATLRLPLRPGGENQREEDACVQGADC